VGWRWDRKEIISETGKGKKKGRFVWRMNQEAKNE